MCVITEHAEYSLRPNPAALLRPGEAGGGNVRNLHPPRDRGTAPSGEEKGFVAVTPRARRRGLRLDWGPLSLPSGHIPRSAPSPCGLLDPSSPNKSAAERRVVPHSSGPRRAGRLRAGPGRRVAGCSGRPGLRELSPFPPAAPLRAGTPEKAKPGRAESGLLALLLK